MDLHISDGANEYWYPWLDDIDNKVDAGVREIVRVGDRKLPAPAHQATFTQKDIRASKLHIQLLEPPLLLDLRAGASRLTKYQFEQIRRRGEITFFIHGFNVPMGHFANSVMPDHVQTAISVLTDMPVPHPASGLHEWLVCMEHNVNRANGHYRKGDYTRYQRICHVVWPGVTKHIFDYMGLVPKAKLAGEYLLKAIQPLIQANIRINIIAHSLGAEVCLSLLGHLIKRHMREKIQHVYLWQSAVPCDVFENDGEQYLETLERCFILYSRNDDILGDLRCQHDDWIKLSDPNEPKLYLLIDIVLRKIMNNTPYGENIRSIYHLARLFQHPMEFFVESHGNRCTFFNNIKPDDINTIRDGKSCASHSMQPTHFNKLKAAFILVFEDYALENRKGWLSQKHYWQAINGNLYRAHQFAEDMATITYFLMTQKKYHPKSALGFKGMKKFYAKVIQIDQTKVLHSHSGMKHPSEDVFNRVYKRLFS